MINSNIQNKKIAYWGTGQVCNNLIENKKINPPDIFIDSNRNNELLFGKKVYVPNEIENWNEYFIVITVVHFAEIEEFLKSLKMQKGKDYIHYYEIIEFKNYKSIKREVLDLKRDNPTSKVTLFTAVSGNKREKYFKKFYEAYKQSHKSELCVVLSTTYGVGDLSYENMGFILLDAPYIMLWNGYDETSQMLDFIKDNGDSDVISEEEYNCIVNIEKTLSSENEEAARKITAYNYSNLKEIFELLQPQKLIMWADARRMDYILTDVAKKKGVPYCYLEFGWIPGTIQMDRRGIGGRSEYVSGDSKLKDISEKELENIKVSQIIEYVRDKKLDTSMFRYNADDESVFSRLDSSKKCIFFPGTGGGKPVFNFQSEVWKKEISPMFCSSREVLLYLAEICMKNDWQLLYKEHPGSPSVYDEQVDGYGDVIFQVNDMEIDRILNRADAVVIGTHSTIEFRTLIYKKPLITLGCTMLSISDCAYVPHEKQTIEEVIKKALLIGYTERQDKNFNKLVGRLLVTCLWDDQTERELRYGLDIRRNSLID